MIEKKDKKISEKGVKWGLAAVLAVIIWGFLIYGYYGLSLNAGTYVGVIAWIVFTYFGWKFTFSLKLFALGSLANPEATSWGERFKYGIIVTLIGLAIKLILSVLIGVFVTPYVLAKMLTPKATAWLRRKEELKDL